MKQAIEQSAGDLMIVSHLPFLGKLVALLVADNEETEIVAFKFGCVVCVDVVAYGLTSSLRGGRLASCRRHRFHGIAIFGFFIAGGWFLPGRKRVVPYSIQWLKRLRPALFRQDLIALFDLLKQQKIKPLIAHRLPLVEARHAHELLGKGGVTGKIVLVRNGLSLGSGAA